MATVHNLRSDVDASANTLNEVFPVVVQLDDLPVEYGDKSIYGDVSWRTLISADRTPTSDLLLGVADFPPDGVLKPHRHEPAEFYLCLNGSGLVTIEGIEHQLTSGSAVFIPGNAEHGVLAGSDGLTIAYGFAQQSFTDINYVFSSPGSQT